MQLTLPSLTVIDRGEPYAFSHVEVPIFEEERSIDAGHLDLVQMKVGSDYVAERGTRRIDRYIQLDVASRFLQAPGDPAPFVRREMSAIGCGALSGVAAVYCAVMARR